MSEQKLENIALSWFHDNGYDGLFGPDIAPEGNAPARKDYRDVVLKAACLQHLSGLTRIFFSTPLNGLCIR